MLGYSLGCTNSKVIGSDEGIKLTSINGGVIGTILVDVDGITLGIYVGTNMTHLKSPYLSS